MPGPIPTWRPFYDPVLYDNAVGPGGRVHETYQRLVGETPRTCLDVGCGTGQVLVALAQQGHRVTGLDISPEMLATAQKRLAAAPEAVRRRTRLIQGDLLGAQLEGTYERILLANELIAHITDADELVAVLRRCRELAPAGMTLLDLPAVDWVGLAAAIDWHSPAHYSHGCYPIGTDGSTVAVAEEVRFDPSRWTVHKTFEYRYLSPDGTVDRTTLRYLVQRVWTWQEARFALSLAGFDVTAQEHDDPDDARIFLIAAARSANGHGSR